MNQFTDNDLTPVAYGSMSLRQIQEVPVRSRSAMRLDARWAIRITIEVFHLPSRSSPARKHK